MIGAEEDEDRHQVDERRQRLAHVEQWPQTHLDPPAAAHRHAEDHREQHDDDRRHETGGEHLHRVVPQAEAEDRADAQDSGVGGLAAADHRSDG